MGRFSTTVQVKCNSDRTSFIDSFCDVMKKRGFVACSEEEAAASYILAYGDDGWATLANEEYKNNPKKAYEDSQQIAAAIKTSAFSVEVVDSDFAIMTLYTPDGTEDRVVVGDGSGYDVPEMAGDRKLWEPLFADGRTWEQFSEAAAAREIFVEDALGKVAAVLGIDSYYIDADYDDVLEKADGNNNILALHFNAAQEKVMSLNTAFVKVFGEALAPLGYKPVKGKYPYLVRVIPGGEIIHVITCEESLCSYPNARKFDIVGGIATVYRYRIDLDYSSKHNNTWLNPIGTFYARTVSKTEYNQQTFESLDGIRYKENDNLSLLNAMNRALEFANKYMLPYLNRAVDLKSSLNCIKVLRQKYSTNNFSYPLNFEGCGHHDEGFLYIKTEDEALMNTLKGKIDGTILCDEQSRQKAVKKYAFFTDPEVLTELERRKAANTEILKSCLPDINSTSAPSFTKDKEKPMTLNSAFVKVFGEALEPLGFKKIKYPYPYFLRIVGGEVIHIITFRKMSGHPAVDGLIREDYGQYDIVCKVETVYSRDISLPTNHLERDSSFLSRREIYVGEHKHIVNVDEDSWKRANENFPFKLGDEKQMLVSFEYAFEATKQSLLPALNSTVDLNSYLEFIYKFSSSSLFLKYEQGNFDCFNEYDGLIHIKADTCDSYVERIEKRRKIQFDSSDEHNKRVLKNDPEKLAYHLKIVDNDRKEFESKSRDRQCLAFKMFTDKEWCEKALQELERRKSVNMEILRSYGLDL